MKITNLLLITLLAVVLLIPIVSATPTHIYGEMGATMRNFTLVSLGIENVPGMTLTKATGYYNWISIGLLFLIGAMSSKRMTRFFAILIPVFAALLVVLGWLHAPNEVQTWGTIVVCGAIGIITYMKGSLRENFGGGGPGSLIINIAFYLIILQMCVGLVNASGMWVHPSTHQTDYISSTDPNMTSQFAGNAVLTTSIPQVNTNGGVLSDIGSAAGTFVNAGTSGILMLLQVVTSVVCFAVTINTMFPVLVQSGPMGIALLTVIQLGIWFIYALFFVNLFGKPFPDTTAF